MAAAAGGLADEFTVVAWDAPGCGGSSDPPAAWRLPDYADCLAGFIQALDLGRPHVGGPSWGGGLALELYRRHPEVPRSLVLASALRCLTRTTLAFRPPQTTDLVLAGER